MPVWFSANDICYFLFFWENVFMLQDFNILCEKMVIKRKKLSVESQKGVIVVQRCSIENQKGAIAVQSLWR